MHGSYFTRMEAGLVYYWLVAVISNFIFDFIFPKFCAVCDKEGSFLCQRCRKSLPMALQICPMCTRPSIYGLTHDYCKRKGGIEGLIAIFDYKNEAVRRVVETIKYDFNRELIAEILSGWKLPKALWRTILMPIPLHRRRENWRGFNQAELIAKQVAGKKATLIKGLVRTRATNQQARVVSRKIREENIKGAFGVCPVETELVGKKVILVDDIFTSGVTMRECAKELSKAGVGEVWGLVLAR